VLRLLDYQHYKPNPCGKPSRYPTQKDAATNTASIAQKPVGAWSRLSPTPIETASWKGVKELRHAPAPTRRNPHKTDETKNLPDATTATTSPRYSSHPSAKTPWRQRKKSQEIPYGGRLCAGERNVRLYLQPRAPATHRRRLAAPLRKEVRPSPGTAHRAEQKARRQTKEPSRDPQPPQGAKTEGKAQLYIRPRTSSSVTTSLLLSMSHILSSFALWTAEGSATRV
jgi:hypothetical protein